MATSNREYWEQREAERRKLVKEHEEDYEKRLRRIFTMMQDNIQKEIDSFYAKYAEKEGITVAEAKRRVSQLDIEEYGRKAKHYVETKDLSDEANLEMRIYNLTMKVNRLEMIKSRIGMETAVAYSDVQHVMEEALTGTAMEEFTRQAGILGMSVGQPEKRAHAIINASFQAPTRGEGEPTFSTNIWGRVWGQQAELREDLYKELTIGLVQGRNPKQLAVKIRKKYDTSRYAAERLLVTEMRNVQTMSQKLSYERNGFDEYTFIAEPSCCPECATLNGTHHKVEDMQPGLNAPPMHPWCRCSTAAYMDPDKFHEWVDSGAAARGVPFGEFETE